VEGNLDFVDVRLWQADAVVLFDWLMRVNLDDLPFEDPAQRQALADLLGRLGHVLDVPSRDQLAHARAELLRE
jgi:hypothetical protein